MTNRLCFLLAVPAIAVTVACAKPSPPPEPQLMRVENGTLGLAIASLPEPFEVVTADGDSIHLKAPTTEGGTDGAGHLLISLGAPQGHGVNLLAAANASKAEFEAMPGGRFFGNRELVVPGGSAFTARGGYEHDGSQMEEMWALALHPGDSRRMMKLVYTYPAGDTQSRASQLLTLLGEIEALAKEGDSTTD